MKARIERVSPGGAASFLCRRRRDPRFGFYWHYHPEIELTCIVHSRGRRFVGDSIEPYEDGDAGRIDRVCRLLNDRCTERIPLAEAAAAAHLSIPAFSRFFRRKTGRTLVAYLNELRTGLACRELIESDRPVSDIAFDSGFNNLSNFNRRFRALKGMNPRDYRRQFSARE